MGDKSEKEKGIYEFAHAVGRAIQYPGSWESPTFAADVLEAVKERHNAYVSEADENARLTAAFAASCEEVVALQRRVKELEEAVNDRNEEMIRSSNAAFAEEGRLRAKLDALEGLIVRALRGGR